MAPSSPNVSRPLLVGAAVVIVALALVILRSQKVPEAAPRSIVRPGHSSPSSTSPKGPGTELADELTIPKDSIALSPVIPTKLDESGKLLDWFTLLAVTGDPFTAWRDVAGQLARSFPQDGIVPDEAPGCKIGSLDELRPPSATNSTLQCRLSADGPDSPVRLTSISARLASFREDVTGRYLIHLHVSRPEGRQDSAPPPRERFVTGNVPGPRTRTRRPKTGEPLSPRTTAYEGDNKRYVLLKGSELVARLGEGSYTGGFEVLLKVKPDAKIAQVAEGYAKQAAQNVTSRTKPLPQILKVGETVVTTFNPPGGAGGYSSTIRAIDQPGDEDFIHYELIND